MKKLAILSLSFLFVLTIGQIQAQQQTPQKEKAAIKETKKVLKAERKELRKLDATGVNAISKTSFYASFGDVPDVKWRSSSYFDEATFKKDGHEMTAFFDFYGKLVGTTTLITFGDVPAKGQKEIKSKYRDYNIGPVIFFDDNELNETDMMLYGLQFDDEDNYFVELTKGNVKKMVRVDTVGSVYFFKDL